MTKQSYLIVGSGRMASHMCNYLKLLKLNFNAWGRSTNSELELTYLTDTSTHILFLIKDSAIAELSHLKIFDKKIKVHFSGTLIIPSCHSAHPLMAFTQDLYALEDYLKIPFILSDNSPNFKELLPGLNNPHFQIKEELRPLYHALCVTGGNLMTILWQMVFNQTNLTLNLPNDIFFPYLDQLVKNLKTDANNALTGPFIRGDLETILENQKALSGSPLAAIYQAFRKAYFNNASSSN